MSTAQKNGRERLAFFVERGLLRSIPSRWQLGVGAAIMLPFVLNETPAERERNRRTLLGQVPVRVPLQLLYCPGQALVGTGLSASLSTLVRHVVSAFHDDAVIAYDLQLLQTHPGGLEALAAAAQRIAAGRDPLAWPLTQIVGGPGYHERLVELAAEAAEFRYPDIVADPRFSSLVGFAEFCLTLPDWPEKDFYDFDWRRLGRRGPP